MKNEYVTQSISQTKESPKLHPLVPIPSFLDPQTKRDWAAARAHEYPHPRGPSVAFTIAYLE